MKQRHWWMNEWMKNIIAFMNTLPYECLKWNSKSLPGFCESLQYLMIILLLVNVLGYYGSYGGDWLIDWFFAFHIA